MSLRIFSLYARRHSNPCDVRKRPKNITHFRQTSTSLLRLCYQKNDRVIQKSKVQPKPLITRELRLLKEHLQEFLHLYGAVHVIEVLGNLHLLLVSDENSMQDFSQDYLRDITYGVSLIKIHLIQINFFFNRIFCGFTKIDIEHAEFSKFWGQIQNLFAVQRVTDLMTITRDLLCYAFEEKRALDAYGFEYTRQIVQYMCALDAHFAYLENFYIKFSKMRKM